MSPSDKRIRVVKRRKSDHLAEPQNTPDCELKTESQTRLEIFKTITSWIEEQRETKEELQRRDRHLLRDAPTNIF